MLSSPVRGDEVIVSYSFASRRFTLHEPVLESTVKNATAQPIQLDLGKSYNGNFVVSFTGLGKVTAQSRGIRTPGFGASGQVRIEPGETYEKNLLVNHWFDFDSARTYEIEVRLGKAIETSGVDTSVRMATFHDTIKIAAEDSARLNKFAPRLQDKLKKPRLIRRPPMLHKHSA